MHVQTVSEINNIVSFAFHKNPWLPFMVSKQESQLVKWEKSWHPNTILTVWISWTFKRQRHFMKWDKLQMYRISWFLVPCLFCYIYMSLTLWEVKFGGLIDSYFFEWRNNIQRRHRTWPSTHSQHSRILFLKKNWLSKRLCCTYYHSWDVYWFC